MARGRSTLKLMARIIFFGTPEHVVCVPEALKRCGHNLVAIVTQPPKPVGRKKIITPSPVAVWSQKNGVKIIDGKPSDIIKELSTLGADLGVLEAYGRILPQTLLNLFPNGIINVHPSLLPKYRGSSPIQAALLNGDQTTGLTIIKLDNEMDHGPVLIQKEFPTQEKDTLETLQERLFKISAEMLCAIIPDYLVGKIILREQDHSKATYTWKTNETKDKAYFDINNPPTKEALENMARAFFPWPCAWTKWNEKIIKIFPEDKIQMEGKTKVTFKQFKEGYPNFPLEI